MDAGIITLVSVALNTVAALFAPLIARRVAAQQEKLKRAEEGLTAVGAGIRIIEQAVEENKDALTSTGAGNRIAQTIRNYGPAAREVVDTARSVARTLREAQDGHDDILPEAECVCNREE